MSELRERLNLARREDPKYRVERYLEVIAEGIIQLLERTEQGEAKDASRKERRLR